MATLTKLAASLLAACAVLALAGFLLPQEYVVRRAVTIDAPPARIHALAGDWKRWEEWSPWNAQRYPGLVCAFGGTGTTGVLGWTSATGGDGTLRFISLGPERGVQYELENDGPAQHSSGALEYAPKGDTTTVTWRASGILGPSPVARWRGLFADARVGPALEQGLADLKRAVEAPH